MSLKLYDDQEHKNIQRGYHLWLEINIFLVKYCDYAIGKLRRKWHEDYSIKTCERFR